MNSRIVLMLIMLLASCNKEKEIKTFKVLDYDLPRLNPSIDCGASIRYKNSLHEGNYFLDFNVLLIYSKSPFEFNSSDYKAQIESQLNTDFKEQGIKFTVTKERTTLSSISIKDYETLFKDFYEPNYIIVILCDDEEYDFSGIVNKIPGTMAAVQKSVISDRKTITHEIGHILGLMHIFSPDNLGANTLNTGDQICDTPSYNIMDHKTDSCKFIGPPKYTEEELNIIVPNYMNYAFEKVDCRKKFTPQQSLAMRWYIENFPELLNTIKNE